MNDAYLSPQNWLGVPVYNSAFGHGRVIGYRQRYREAQVAFEDITLWIGIEDLKKIAPPESDDVVQETPAKKARAKDLARFKAKKIIEALRLGVVPEKEIEDFTFHREYEIKQVEKEFARIEKEGGASSIILGEYGSGKSHFLDLIRSKALKKGYIVAKAEMDAYEVRPHRPKRLYHALMENIRTEPDSPPMQLRDFILQCAQHKDVLSIIKDHRFLFPLFSLILNQNASVNEILWEFVEGNDLRLDYVRKNIGYSAYKIPALYDSAYAADLYCYILTGLSYLAHEIGYKGLVILIDEGESIYMVDPKENLKANNFLRGLILSSLSRGEQENKLIHSLKRKFYPYSFAEKNYLYTVLAMTQRLEGEDQPDWMKVSSLIELTYFDEEDMQAMFDKLLQIYKSAYHSFQPDSIADLNDVLYHIWLNLERDNLKFRQCLKALVESLDLKRHYPNKKLSLPKPQFMYGI